MCEMENKRKSSLIYLAHTSLRHYQPSGDHLNVSKNTICLQLIVVLVISVILTEGNPVKGVTNCLNNEDCLGANRLCYRNTTMTEGICICRQGYKRAVGERIKCLHIVKRECHTKLDCEVYGGLFLCLSSMETQKDRGQEYLTTYYKHYRRAHGVKYCMGSHLGSASMGSAWDHHPGLKRNEFDSSLGLRPGTHEDHLNNRYVRFSRNNHMNAGFNPEYIKFVEDCMLVLFLLCVLITLLVVHRASCARQFRRARRDGPLRYIIPHSDDQPPPYANYGPPPNGTAGLRADTVTDGDVVVGSMVRGDMVDERDGVLSSDSRNTINMASHVQSVLGVSRKSAETPPPTYDEALAISQALSASMATNDTCPSVQLSANNNFSHPSFHLRDLYITLPSPHSIDNNQNSLPRSSNVVNSENSSGNQTVSSVSTESGASTGESRQENQSNVNTDIRQQQAYPNAQRYSDLVSNSINEGNQNIESTSPAVDIASPSQGNP